MPATKSTKHWNNALSVHVTADEKVNVNHNKGRARSRCALSDWRKNPQGAAEHMAAFLGPRLHKDRAPFTAAILQAVQDHLAANNL